MTSTFGWGDISMFLWFVFSESDRTLSIILILQTIFGQRCLVATIVSSKYIIVVILSKEVFEFKTCFSLLQQRIDLLLAPIQNHVHICVTHYTWMDRLLSSVILINTELSLNSHDQVLWIGIRKHYQKLVLFQQPWFDVFVRSSEYSI